MWERERERKIGVVYISEILLLLTDYTDTEQKTSCTREIALLTKIMINMYCRLCGALPCRAFVVFVFCIESACITQSKSVWKFIARNQSQSIMQLKCVCVCVRNSIVWWVFEYWWIVYKTVECIFFVFVPSKLKCYISIFAFTKMTHDNIQLIWFIQVAFHWFPMALCVCVYVCACVSSICFTAKYFG